MIEGLRQLAARFTGARDGAAGPIAVDPQAPSLVVRGLRKRFDQVEVLRQVDLTVERGEFVTLLGPSGCGKTTLLRIVAGLERQDGGEVLLGGRAVDDLPASRRPVNTVFQSYALFPHLSVRDNVAFGLRARGFAEGEVARRVADGLRLLRLEELGDRRPQQLSGGQRQRVALARALVNEPEVLLLDEPMSALDAKLRAELQLELRRLQRELGKTFILVTHDQDEAMVVSDRVVVMHQGRIEQVGPTAEVYERPCSRFVAEFLGAANLIPARRIGPSRVATAVGELTTRTDPAWAEGTVAIHPEWVRLHEGPDGPNVVPARVRDSVYRGDHVELEVEPGPLRLMLPPDRRPTAGEAVRLELPAARVEPLRD